MAPTVGECVCRIIDGHTDEFYVNLTRTDVKEYIRYRLDDIPFTTARKINHFKCNACHGAIGLDTNKEFNADLAKNRAFINEQDRMYTMWKDDEGTTSIIPMFGNEDTSYDNWGQGYTAPPQPKQWHRGAIHYLSFVHVDDKVKIVPRIALYEVYCNDAEVLSVASKQFVKPDGYFKLTSIERFQQPITTFQPYTLPEMGTLD